MQEKLENVIICFLFIAGVMIDEDDPTLPTFQLFVPLYVFCSKNFLTIHCSKNAKSRPPDSNFQKLCSISKAIFLIVIRNLHEI